MRRSALFVVGCALSLYLIGAAPAWADNGPHKKNWGVTPDACAACHRAHTAQAPYLLKQSQPEICFSCHGTSATGSNLDVQGGVGYSGTERSGGVAGALRGGGFTYALIKSSEPSETGKFSEENVNIPVLSSGAAVTSAHTVDGTEHTLWGNGPVSATPNAGKGIDLACGSCHDPHGNGMYRILKPKPVESGLTKTETGVEIPDVATKEYRTADYGKFAEPNNPAFYEKITAWCSTCHTRYLAPSGSAQTTSSGDAIFTWRHATEYATGTHRPQCITCHVAHGSNAKMTGATNEEPWPGGSTGRGDDSTLLRIDNRGVCQACHRK